VLRNQWLGFQLGQERVLQGPKRSIPSGVGQVQLLVTWSLQKTLVGLAFASMVVGVAPVEPAIGQEAFVTGGARDPPLCEKIKDTLR
jgi:hypothetical protein